MSSKKIKLIIAGLGIIAAVGAIAALVFAIAIVTDLPSTDEITNFHITQSTKILDRTAKVVLYDTGGDLKRTVVPLDKIPENVKDATVAIEDERFYTQKAFDWKAIIRAFATNIRHGRIVQGGSTITQQLAKNAFLSPEQTVTRKLKELVLAIKISNHYSKDKILELYLNVIPYGPTIYGIENASRAFFGKSASELSLAESAVLAALPKAPSYYSPWGNHKDELLNRQKAVLNKMRELGYIEENELQEALKEKIAFQPQSQGILAPHFVFMVQEYLVEKYGEEAVNRGGLQVVTTLDWGIQEEAEKAVAEGASRNEELYNGKNAALVAQDPATGQIIAMVGSRDYFDIENEGNFNVATQGLRQPGSTLKPFVYMTAFMKGYSPNTVLFDVPTEFSSNNPSCPPIVNINDNNRECFHPENFDRIFRGPVSLKNALAQSMNIPAVKTLYLAGLKDVIKNANQWGLTTLTNPDRYGLSVVLGGGEVRLVDLVSAYSTLAGEGVMQKQTYILEIKDSEGKTLEKFTPNPDTVIEARYARMINHILSDVSARAPLFSASLSYTTLPNHQVALKTGTSNDYRDAWVVGYTPTLVAGIWAGNNDNTPMQARGSSILAAVPIWHAFMSKIADKIPPGSFTQPDSISGSRPILNGEYAPNGEIHTILHYVDKNDPSGNPPGNPFSDPQYVNWETAIQTWLQHNSSTLEISGPTSSIAITIDQPQQGGFISAGQNLEANITASKKIKRISVRLNQGLILDVTGDFGNGYHLTLPLEGKPLVEQNMIEIEASDEFDKTAKRDVIFYRQD